MGRRRLTEEEREASIMRRREMDAERKRRRRMDPVYREQERKRDTLLRQAARMGLKLPPLRPRKPKEEQQNDSVKGSSGENTFVATTLTPGTTSISPNKLTCQKNSLNIISGLSLAALSNLVPKITDGSTNKPVICQNPSMNNASGFGATTKVPIPKLTPTRKSQVCPPSAVNGCILKMVQPSSVPNNKVPIARLRPNRTPPVSNTPRPMFLFKAASDPAIPAAPEDDEQEILGLPSAMEDASKEPQPENGCNNEMKQEKDVQNFTPFVKVHCKSISIGSYKVATPDSTYPVLIESNRVTLSVPPIGDDSRLIGLQLSDDDIEQIIVSPAKQTPAIFILPSADCAEVIRGCLNMSEPGAAKGYLDPDLTEESKRTIKLLLLSIEKEHLQFLRKSSFRKKVSEVSPQVANPATLVRSTQKSE